MTIRIAAVSFLNTIPLIEWFITQPHLSVEVTSVLPSRMAELLHSGEADVALLPIVEVFRGQSAGMVSGTGIACEGNVDSVKLFTRGDPRQLTSVRTDRGSRTSVALLRVLMGEVFSNSPEFIETKPSSEILPASGEGLLIIGDRCFEYEAHLDKMGTSGVQSFDLGGLWFQLTGLPFVFAAWSLAPGFPRRVGPTRVAELGNLLDQARDFGLKNLDRLAEREASLGQLGFKGKSSQEAIEYYFQKSLRYKIGDREMAGARHFQELCVKYGEAPGGSLKTSPRGQG